MSSIPQTIPKGFSIRKQSKVRTTSQLLVALIAQPALGREQNPQPCEQWGCGAPAMHSITPGLPQVQQALEIITYLTQTLGLQQPTPSAEPRGIFPSHKPLMQFSFPNS